MPTSTEIRSTKENKRNISSSILYISLGAASGTVFLWLSSYAFPNANNGADVAGIHDYWNSFDEGSEVAAGDVFVICHPSSDASILSECDQTHTYLSNGDDGFCLVEGRGTRRYLRWVVIALVTLVITTIIITTIIVR